MRQGLLDLDRLPANAILESRHYLGKSRRAKFVYQDELGVMVWANPSSRRLPQQTWLELVRWCLRGQKNDGSRQWGRVRRVLLVKFPDITTLVSYSDPSMGIPGLCIRPCNWGWAPTWHRLKPNTDRSKWHGMAHINSPSKIDGCFLYAKMQEEPRY